MAKANIERILTQTFHPAFLQVVDESHKHAGHAGSLAGGHYKIIIASKRFEGKKLLDVHRMIYRALEPLRGSIHALAIRIRPVSNY